MTRAWDVRLTLLAAAGLLAAWSFVTPIFEGPDEFAHWQYARHLHDTWRLPVYAPTFGEGNSPPLYYAAIASVATRTVTPPPAVWIDGTDAFAMPLVPRFFLGAADDLRHYWPIRRARLVTVLLSLIAIALCARAGFEATGRVSTALLTAGIAAFLPQFTFRGSHISNDALVTTMAAAALWTMVAIVRRGFTRRLGLLAAIALAAAFLTKINAICLAPALVLVVLTERAPWRTRLTRLAVVVGVAAALAAPWCLRNVSLYGDPLAIGAMRAAVAPLVVERSLRDVLVVDRLPRELFKTFVGSFGHMTVKLPRTAYLAYLGMMAIAGIGLVYRLTRTRDRIAGDSSPDSPDRDLPRLVLVLATIVICAFAIVVRINLQFHQPQGRYLFPALPAIALAMALGLDTGRAWAARTIVAALAAANLLILTLVVMPAYEPPPVPTISKALTIVGPQAGSDEITETEPEFAADVRVAAQDALFVIFEVEGPVPAPADAAAGTTTAPLVLEGVVTLTVARSSGPDTAGAASIQAEEVRLPFHWRADGRPRTIYLTLLGRPDWRGTVTSLRIRPIGPIAHPSPDQHDQKLPIVIRHVRLAGSIPSYDY